MLPFPLSCKVIKNWIKNLVSHSADGLRQLRKLCLLYYYANYRPRLGSWLAESRSISYFSPWRQGAYKTKQCFLTRRLSDPFRKKIYQSLGGVFFFHSPQSNYLAGTRTWTSSNWRTNPKRSHEVLNGRNRESGAQTPARWERGRKQRCSNASVQHRLKKKKLIDAQNPNLRCAISARKPTFSSGFEENK